ncbi:transposase, partial [Cyanobium sp. Cruz CV13-4-11]|nr:transposase [Cyanobium sp. Cruz CV13-4-11]
MLLTVKKSQRTLHRQIADQFRYQRHFPVEESDFEKSHGRQVLRELRARNATEAIRERWIGASWIIELVSSGQRDGKPFRHVHQF